MKTEVVVRGANCPVCLDTIRRLLLSDPRVDAVTMSFPDQCLVVEHTDLPNGDLVQLLRRNLHGIEVADNGEQVMTEVVPAVGAWHCHAPEA